MICQSVEGQPQICMDVHVNASGVTCNWRENSFYTTTFSFSLPFSALTKLYSFYIETFLPPNMPDYLLYKLTQPCPKAFWARSILDSIMSCDVTEKYSPRTRSLARSFPDFARTTGQERTTRDSADTNVFLSLTSLFSAL